MSKSNKGVLYPVFFMMAVTAVFTLSLAVVNALSIDRIHELESLQKKQTILYVLGLTSLEKAPAGEISTLYNTTIQEKDSYYIALIDGKILGYVFPVEGPGLWGTMSGYAAIDQTGTHLLGMALPTHSETPGLGGRVNEPWFTEQFRGIPLTVDGRSSFIYRPAEGGNIDAITGATLTSTAVTKLLNEDTQSFIKNLQKGGQLHAE